MSATWWLRLQLAGIVMMTASFACSMVARGLIAYGVAPLATVILTWVAWATFFGYLPLLAIYLSARGPTT